MNCYCTGLHHFSEPVGGCIAPGCESEPAAYFAAAHGEFSPSQCSSALCYLFPFRNATHVYCILLLFSFPPFSLPISLPCRLKSVLAGRKHYALHLRSAYRRGLRTRSQQRTDVILCHLQGTFFQVHRILPACVSAYLLARNCSCLHYSHVL